MRTADCHPEERHVAKGFCLRCYNKQPKRYAKNRARHKTPEMRAYYRSRATPEKTRAHNLKSKYGTTDAHVESLWIAQGSRCAFFGHGGCGGYAKCVDHETLADGRILIRGILCMRHNSALGMFGDGHNDFLAVCAYLSKNK